MTISVLLVDDHELIRQGTASLFRTRRGFRGHRGGRVGSRRRTPAAHHPSRRGRAGCQAARRIRAQTGRELTRTLPRAGHRHSHYVRR